MKDFSYILFSDSNTFVKQVAKQYTLFYNAARPWRSVRVLRISGLSLFALRPTALSFAVSRGVPLTRPPTRAASLWRPAPLRLPGGSSYYNT